MAKSCIPPQVLAELEHRGHEVILTGVWSNSKTMGIRYHKERGVILGGASPKRHIGYAIGW